MIQWYKDWKSAINPAKINLKNIKSVIQSWIRKVYLPKHIKEQAIMRTVLAKECVQQGTCTYCGCHMSKIYSDAPCARKYVEPTWCYDEMMNKKDWNEFKSKIDFNYFIEQAKEIKNDRS